METVTMVVSTTECVYTPSGYLRRPTFTVRGTAAEHGSDHVLFDFSITMRDDGQWDYDWLEPTDYALDEDGEVSEEYERLLPLIIRQNIVTPIGMYWEEQMLRIVEWVSKDEMHILRGLV